jgi:hypothetical protein
MASNIVGMLWIPSLEDPLECECEESFKALGEGASKSAAAMLASSVVTRERTPPTSRYDRFHSTAIG